MALSRDRCICLRKVEYSETSQILTLLARELLGMRCSPPTLWRWCVRGTRAGKLDAVYAGGRWMTTRAALLDFLERQSAAQQNKFSRNKPDDASDAELEECGLV